MQKNNLLVSIFCPTYNHSKYIGQCLNGIVMQKTNFQFEVIVQDDASTDDSQKIIKEFAEKYNFIVPVLHTENIYSKGGDLNEYFFKTAKGKYIALCEGDDYWTDPYKLQKQVDFMGANPDCSIVFHAAEHINEATGYKFIHKPKNIPKNNKFHIKDAILGGGGFMTTNSMVFRKKYIQERPKWMQNVPAGDLALMLLLSTKGNIGYINDVMSVYRMMTPNSWSNSMQDKNKRKKHHYRILKMWDDFDIWTNKKYHSTIVLKKIKNRWMFFISRIRSLII